VAKIVGPGNAFVAAAKRQVFGVVGIDMLAGPSEVLIVADGDNDPDWIAADILAQAEHDPAAQAILMTDDPGLADAVEAAVERQLATLPRAETARASWRGYGAVICLRALSDALPLIDRIAPEHLELAVADPGALAAKVRNAGAIFLGRHTPEAVGDYLAGPNHVLPTARWARFSSGLSVLDFMKRTSLLQLDAGSLRALGPAAEPLDLTAGVDQALLAREVRVAPRADVDAQVLLRGARLERVAAAASDGGGGVVGVDLGLHLGSISSSRRAGTPLGACVPDAYGPDAYACAA